MQLSRIAELLHPFLPITGDRQLTARDLQNISTYIDILHRWNSRINLTAIRNEEEIVTRHFGESFFTASHLFPCKSEKDGVDSVARSKLADVGSGAGFPGIPIKLWAPGVALTLIESNHRKAAFLREVVRSITLTNVNVINTRAEEITQTFELVTLRAVERFKDILPVALQLLAPSGRLALLISRPQAEQASSVLPQLNWQPQISIPESDSRILLIGSRGGLEVNRWDCKGIY